MGLFSKTTYKEVCLPFIYDQYSPEHTDDVKCGVICIEAYGIIDGMERYFYSGFTLKDPAMYDNGDFDWMIHYLKSTPKKVVVNLISLKVRSLSILRCCPRASQLHMTTIAS